jgi:hypothetical protein
MRVLQSRLDLGPSRDESSLNALQLAKDDHKSLTKPVEWIEVDLFRIPSQFRYSIPDGKQTDLSLHISWRPANRSLTDDILKRSNLHYTTLTFPIPKRIDRLCESRHVLWELTSRQGSLPRLQYFHVFNS